MGRARLSGRADTRPPAGLGAALAIQSFRPHVGGAELQLERLVPRLADRGIRTEILTRAVRGWPRTEPIPGSVIRRTPLAGESPLASLVYVVAALGRLLVRRSRTDLVHAHGALSPATIALGGRLLGLPCLVTVLGTGDHGDLARLARKPLGRVRARLLFRSAWFAALSAEAREELLAHGVPAQRILGLPNGVDIDVYRPASGEERRRLRERLGLPGDRFVGTFVGRLHPVKDVDTLLAAAALVPELTLVVVGDGPERGRLEREAGRLGIESRVSFRGLSSEVADVLRASDAFLLSSHGEGMSNALLEAMACGLPCLASRSVGGAGELLGAGRGVLLPGGDVEAWVAAIARLAGDPGLRRETGTAAAAFVAAELSLDAAADRLARAYAAIAGGAGRRGRG
jgi:glycosyltransferase involved in cell wall biosynthesis